MPHRDLIWPNKSVPYVYPRQATPSTRKIELKFFLSFKFIEKISYSQTYTLPFWGLWKDRKLLFNAFSFEKNIENWMKKSQEMSIMHMHGDHCFMGP